MGHEGHGEIRNEQLLMLRKVRNIISSHTILVPQEPIDAMKGWQFRYILVEFLCTGTKNWKSHTSK